MCRKRFIIVAVLTGLLFPFCSKKKDQVPEPVRLGVTPWPAAYSLADQQQAYAFIGSDCDFVSHHIDEGIPYDEAFNHRPMPVSLVNEVKFRKENTPSGKAIFLSVSALDLSRKKKVGYWRNNEGTPSAIRQYWESLPFDHPDVITAYVNFVNYLVGEFSPAWINFGVESNSESWDETEFQRYKIFCRAVYTALKKSHPGTPVFLSVMVSEAPKAYQNAKELMPYTDWVAMSAYPYVTVSSSASGNTNPDLFPTGYFEHWLDLSPEKPWCFSETGYIAQNLDVPEYNLHKEGRPEWQNRYLEKLGDLMRTRKGQFLLWFCHTDYDALIETLKSTGDYQPLFLFWRDIGLYDENHKARPVLQTWRDLRKKN
ncbi:hypothetical protein [Flavihumibacter profundi]|uniref:hypothetical protein n=1 Tax=Flavihumibacter profundi TaxID=2716883 RepID=UPI001CC711CB|nr:hypothetical protein [Flavihumibacter profundi]MBZ5858955.1 hypothetical protein [Flavihumibacter profundi]